MTKRIVRKLRCAFVLLATIGVGAATSDVADAVQSGDAAAVRALLTAEVGRERTAGRRRDGAALGRVSRRPADRRSPAESRRQREGGQQLRRHAAVAWPPRRGNAAIVQRLLEAGADANERMRQPRHRAHDGGPDRQRRNDEAAARSRRRRERDGEHARHDGVDVGGGAGTCGGRPAAHRPRRGRQGGVGPRLAGPARALRQGRRSAAVARAEPGPGRQPGRSPEHAGQGRRRAHAAGVCGSRQRSRNRCASCSRPAPT